MQHFQPATPKIAGRFSCDTYLLNETGVLVWKAALQLGKKLYLI